MTSTADETAPLSMDFELDETARAIVEAAAGVLDGEGLGSLGTDTDGAVAERAWKGLGQAGLLSLSVPKELGGEGLGVLASMLVLAEVGRRGVALPALATLALGVLPVARWGTAQQQSDLLVDSPLLTAAIREPRDPQPTAPATTCGPDLAVTGTKVGVPYADRARAILVPVSLGLGATAVAVVEPTADGVTLTRTPSSTGSPEWTVRLDGVGATGVLGEEDTGAAVADLYRLALAGACALGDGALAGALALTSTHVGSREQFGRPLAAFQAVAQQIADVYVASRTLHLATLSACWRLSEGLPAGEDVDVAAYWLAAQAPTAMRTCHHLHGGLGLDVTYPLHRYSSLVKDLVRMVGGTDYRLDALAILESGGRLSDHRTPRSTAGRRGN
jgi:alkylation response protein AidB-like acyl-CoA dehydrogenase